MLKPTKLLELFGLTDKEAKIYIALLQLGPASPAAIAKKAALNRSTSYVLLDDLVKKEFISLVAGKKRIFKAEDPNKLQLRIRSNTAEFDRSLPLLLNLMNSEQDKPLVRFFTDLPGIKQAYRESLLLAPKSEILAFGSAEAVETKLKGFIEDYLKMRVDKGITVRAITSADEGGKLVASRDKLELRQTRLLKPSVFTEKTEINIYAHKIMIISLEEGELLAIIIESKILTESFRQMFEIIWSSLE